MRIHETNSNNKKTRIGTNVELFVSYTLCSCRQESPENIPEGETPHSVTLFAFDNLVDVARPGDRVEVTGILRPNTNSNTNSNTNNNSNSNR